MASNTLTFTGNENKIYDLEELSTTDTRLSNTALKLHVHEYNPDSSNPNTPKTPTPEDTVEGQIWLAKVRADI